MIIIIQSHINIFDEDIIIVTNHYHWLYTRGYIYPLFIYGVYILRGYIWGMIMAYILSLIIADHRSAQKSPLVCKKAEKDAWWKSFVDQLRGEHGDE